MKCPVDNTELVMSERQGVEIDYCPQCRGVWLDRGELDKIVERYEKDSPQSQNSSYDDRNSRQYDRGHKKRGSWLGEIFD